MIITQISESMGSVNAVAAALAVLGDLNVEKWTKIKEDMRQNSRFVVSMLTLMLFPGNFAQFS